MTYIQDNWCALAKEFSIPNEASATIFNKIVNSYGERHRRYHTLDHIEYCLKTSSKSLYKFNRVQKIAIWFHDIVYDPLSKTNEENSFIMARNLIGKYLDDGDVAKLFKMIMATKHNSKDAQENVIDMQVAYVMDIDLCVLGAANYKDYRNEYAKKVALEYIMFYSNSQYVKGRTSFIKNVLAEKSIFNTSEFRESYESYARRNLEMEMKELIASDRGENHP